MFISLCQILPDFANLPKSKLIKILQDSQQSRIAVLNLQHQSRHVQFTKRIANGKIPSKFRPSL